jgi:hypothetical protein
MPVNWPNGPRVNLSAPATAPAKLLPAVQKETKGFEYGGLKDEFNPSSSSPGSTRGFDIEQRKGLATPKK